MLALYEKVDTFQSVELLEWQAFVYDLLAIYSETPPFTRDRELAVQAIRDSERYLLFQIKFWTMTVRVRQQHSCSYRNCRSPDQTSGQINTRLLEVNKF